jgi:hypothetical protein
MSGCDAPDAKPPVWPDPPPGPLLDIVIRPANVDTINLGIRTSTVPIALGDDATLRWATLHDGRLIMGGRAGLFDIQTNTVVQTSSIPVRDLAVDETYGFIVSNAEGLHVYDGLLLQSQLDETLKDEEIRVLMSRGDEMWLAGDTGVHRLENKILHSFDGMNDIVDLLSFEDGSIVAESSIDGFHVLRADDGDWKMQSLSEELTLSEVVPGFDDRIIGIEQATGNLVERVIRARDDAAVWRRVALTRDVKDPGATDIETMAVDPTTGFVWLIQKDVLSRIETGRVVQMARPAELGAVLKAEVSDDGALWLNDGVFVFRVGNEGPPISYAEQIKPFSDQNCQRCHAPMVGVSTTILDSYEDWKNNIDNVIFQLESMRMPTDQQTIIGGSRDLARKWRDGGMRP